MKFLTALLLVVALISCGKNPMKHEKEDDIIVIQRPCSDCHTQWEFYHKEILDMERDKVK